MNEKLKTILLKFLFSNKGLLFCFNYFLRVNRENKYLVEVNKRKSTSIFNYQDLNKSLIYYPFDSFADNNLYGIAYTLKKYAGISQEKKLNYFIEHGFFFGTYVSQNSVDAYSKNILSFGNSRKKSIESKTKKTAICIGPYINYAKSLMPIEKIESLKVKLGNVLLVFPSHSTENLKSNYKGDEFINIIKERAKNYDTVLICLYYIDSRDKNIINLYANNNFRIVTAGHKYDFNFLPRLKSIIKLSDYVLSNDLGTHILYCISLGKKQEIKLQKVSYSGTYKKELNLRNTEEQYSLEQEKNKIVNYINNNNLKALEFYVGQNYLKSKDELKEILLN